MADISDKKPDAARLALFSAAMAVGLIAVILWLSSGEPVEDKSYRIRIVPLTIADGVEVLYRPYEPVTEIMIPFPPDQIDHLSVGESANKVSLKAVRNGVVLSGSEPIELVGLKLDKAIPVPRKANPVAQFGVEALVLNMSSFTPVGVDGQKVGDGTGDPSIFTWVSKAEAIEVNGTQVFVDPGLPGTVKETVLGALEPLLFHYVRILERSLGQGPQIMLLYEEGFDGQLTIEGDSLPGQSLIKYTGKGFQKATPEAQKEVLQNLAHEIAHLFQHEVEGVSQTPDWFHEGGAEALAHEALFMTGLWDATAYMKTLTGVKQACADQLKNGPLNGAPRKGAHQAGYVCGQIILVAVTAQQKGANVAAMWRAFLAFAAGQEEGLSEEVFYEFAREWVGDEKFVRSLRSFVQTDYSLADREAVVEQMFQGEL